MNGLSKSTLEILMNTHWEVQNELGFLLKLSGILPGRDFDVYIDILDNFSTLSFN